MGDITKPYPAELRDRGPRSGAGRCRTEEQKLTAVNFSALKQIADRIPEGKIHAIGAAPGIDRRRWQKLADLIEAAALAYGTTSDARFEALLEAVSPPERRARARARKEADSRRRSRRVTDCA